jgi:hypothetical protein
MENIYLWKENGKIFFHKDLSAAKEVDGLSRSPDIAITETEYEAADGLLRIVNGEIFLGKTDGEKIKEEIQSQINMIKTKLSEIDKKSGAGRAVRSLTLKAAEEGGFINEDYNKLHEFEAQAVSLRGQLADFANV